MKTDLFALYGGWIIGAAFLLSACRYLLFAGGTYLIFYKAGLRGITSFKIQPRSPGKKQVQNEIKYSLSSITVFSGVGLLFWWLYCQGLTSIYLQVSQRGWLYFFGSIIVMIVLHDCYFYWTHRLLHTPWLFRKVHKIHHRSINPTPLAAYSFHPVEAFIESLIIFPFVTIFPVHLAAFGIFTFIVLVMNVIGHLGYEFIPARFRAGFYGQIFTSSTHHNLHHQKTKKNYGYYFTFWDQKMKTLHPPPPAILKKAPAPEC